MKYPEQHGIDEIKASFGGELPRQPKADIAHLVAQAGIGVPEIYPDIDTAITAGDRFVARSEHPAELYHSGLGTSFKVDVNGPEQKRGWRGPKAVTALSEILSRDETSFDELTGMEVPGRMGFIHAERWRAELDPEYGRNDKAKMDAFAAQHSLSYWEVAEGHNRYIVADSGKPGRYYIGTVIGSMIGEHTYFTGVDVVENGDIVATYSLEDVAKRTCAPDGEKLVDFYEKVRNSGLFNPDNAAIVELSDPPEAEPIFLQYLPVQPQKEPDFEVSKSSEDAFFVRGATPEEGIEFDLHMRHLDKRDIEPGEPYGTGAGTMGSIPVEECYLPRAEIYVSPAPPGHSAERWTERFMWATVDHHNRSEAFKPKTSVIVTNKAYEALEEAGSWNSGEVEAFLRSDGDTVDFQYWDPNEKKIKRI